MDLISNLEAVLFASGSPLRFERICEIFATDAAEIAQALETLEKQKSQDDSGLSLVCLDGAYQLCTKPETAEYVKRALELRKTPPLSKAALEVLAIIAYNQPATRSFVEQVRGVDSSSIVNSLCEKGLIFESGHLDAPGRPTLFSTTDNFLRCFGMSSLSQLPTPTVELDGCGQLSMADSENVDAETSFESTE